jgi:hypothetical protein
MRPFALVHGAPPLGGRFTGARKLSETQVAAAAGCACITISVSLCITLFECLCLYA